MNKVVLLAYLAEVVRMKMWSFSLMEIINKMMKVMLQQQLASCQIRKELFLLLPLLLLHQRRHRNRNQTKMKCSCRLLERNLFSRNKQIMSHLLTFSIRQTKLESKTKVLDQISIIANLIQHDLINDHSLCLQS